VRHRTLTEYKEVRTARKEADARGSKEDEEEKEYRK
jgi:hypothetical protein